MRHRTATGHYTATLGPVELAGLRARFDAAGIAYTDAHVTDYGDLSFTVAAQDEHRAALEAFDRPWVDHLGWGDAVTGDPSRRRMSVTGRELPNLPPTTL